VTHGKTDCPTCEGTGRELYGHSQRLVDDKAVWEEWRATCSSCSGSGHAATCCCQTCCKVIDREVSDANDLHQPA